MSSLQVGEKRKLSALTASHQFRVTVNYDLEGLDISLFGLSPEHQLTDDRYFIFYNQLESPNGELKAKLVAHKATFDLNLELLPPQTRRLVFVATHDERPVREAKHLRWELNGVSFDPLSILKNERAVMIAELYEHAGEWRVGAVGQGFNGGLQALLESFGGEVVPDQEGAFPLLDQAEAVAVLWDGTPWKKLSDLLGDPEQIKKNCRRCERPEQRFNTLDPQTQRCVSCQLEVQRAYQEFRQAFLQLSFSQDLTAQGWNRLYSWAEQHQLSGRKLLEYIRADAANVLNRAVTLTAQDGILTEEEDQYLQAMLGAFELPAALMHSAYKIMADLRSAQDIRNGQLNTVQTTFAVQSGELCYADVPVDFHRIMSRGARIIPGRLLVTSRCLSFYSADIAYNIRYKNILNIDEHQSGIFIQLSVKQGSGFYSTIEARTLAATIQTMLDVERRQIYLEDGKPSRYIPRHIQNEVYSRDQGKCTQCGSRVELQFDHIIPYSLGGNNEAHNIQLLCKTCNLQKSNRF